jgi:phosphatidylglycerol:prolipoprotein diacylglycerol transferase
MPVFIDHLSPFLFNFGLFGHRISLRWYGLAYAFGFLLTFVYFRVALRQKTITGFSPETLERLTIAIALGVVIGGRLGFAVQHPHEILTDPLFVFRIWEGGMAFFGGLAGTMLAILWVVRRYHLRFLSVTDVAAFPAALGLAVGRIANFVNGELVGKPTNARWGVIFPGVDHLPRHPSQLYEAASHFLLFSILVCVRRWFPAWASAAKGRLSFLFLTLYGSFRFLTDFFRDDDTYWGPFSNGQWVSLLISLAGFIALWRLRVQESRRTIETS